MSKKIQSKIEELLFEVYEKGLQQETTDLTAYYKKIEQALNIPVVSGSLPTSEELQEIVVKIAYSQQGEEQSDDCYAKMGMLHEFISKYVSGNDR